MLRVDVAADCRLHAGRRATVPGRPTIARIHYRQGHGGHGTTGPRCRSEGGPHGTGTGAAKTAPGGAGRLPAWSGGLPSVNPTACSASADGRRTHRVAASRPAAVPRFSFRLTRTARAPGPAIRAGGQRRAPDRPGTHAAVFTRVLERLARAGLVKGKTVGVDATTPEANAAMRSIERRDTGESCEAFVRRPAEASGIETPTRAEPARFDRSRKGRKTSNKEWQSPNDRDAKITKMKDGRTHLARKAEHGVDLETGAVLSVTVQDASKGDSDTLPETLAAAAEQVEAVRPDGEGVEEVVADKGCHSDATLATKRASGASGGRSGTRSARKSPTEPAPAGSGACRPARRTDFFHGLLTAPGFGAPQERPSSRATSSKYRDPSAATKRRRLTVLSSTSARCRDRSRNP